jgi:hypothetical protein
VTATFDVRVRGLDPDLLEQVVEFVDEVFREVRLAGAAAGMGLADDLAHLTQRIYCAGDGREVMMSALRGNDADVDMRLPVGAEQDLVELGLFLDRVDEACRAGLLLALPRSSAVAAMSWWSITEVVRQRYGLPATTFPA